jgi:hypothetical protein
MAEEKGMEGGESGKSTVGRASQLQGREEGVEVGRQLLLYCTRTDAGVAPALGTYLRAHSSLLADWLGGRSVSGLGGRSAAGC